MEVVLGALLEDELSRTGGDDIGNFGEADDAMGDLVVLVLGVKQEALASLGSVGGGGLGVALLLEVGLELLLGDGLVLEVEEPLLLEEAAES